MMPPSLSRLAAPFSSLTATAAKSAKLAVVVTSVTCALTFSGCTSCSEKTPAPAAKEPATAPILPSEAAPPSTAEHTGASAAAHPNPPMDGDAKVYRGPSSNNPSGYAITTGFATETGDPVSQPSALETTHNYITVIGPDSAPIGAFDAYQGAEMHGFLLARDMRHAHYTSTTGAVAEGADARKVTFAPREGGDHALIVVFKPVGKPPQAVSTPVVFRGALPQIAGRGVAGLGLQSRVEGGDVRLTLSPSAPRVGQTITFTAHVRLKFLAFFNEEMGGGEVATFSPAGTSQWTPKEAGTWLAIAAPTAGKTPLTYKIVVAEAEDAVETGKPTPKTAPTAKNPAAPTTAAAPAVKPANKPAH
jgi:hypothetical protein